MYGKNMKKQYQVLNNGKPADCHHCPILHHSWNRSTFSTFKKAEKYLDRWLGSLSPGKGFIKLNTPYPYSIYGDAVEIKEV